MTSLNNFVPSLIQEILRECDESGHNIILKDINMPKVTEFCFDLNIKSPLQICYQSKTFVASTVNKMLEFYSKLEQTSYNQQMLMMSFQDIIEGEKIDNFSFFLKDFDDDSEGTKKHTKLAHYLQRHQHQLGEYSDKAISIKYIKNFEKEHQKDYDMKMQINEIKDPGDLQKGSGKIQVGHFYFDLWAFFLNRRLEAVRMNVPNIKECSLNLSEFVFSSFISQIVDKYHQDIESFVFISKFIEYQFERTQKFYSSLFFMFFVCQVLFVLQLTWIEGSSVVVLNSIQLGIQTILFIIEFITLKDQKIAYFTNIVNWFSLIHFGSFVAYFIFRLRDTNSTLPTLEALEAD